MKAMFYKDGTQAQAGDICFYSEMPFSTYADSLVELVIHDGELCSLTLIGNNGKEYVEVTDQPLPVFSEFSSGDTIEGYTKIGTVVEKDRFTIEHMNAHHPFDASKL